MVWGVGGVGVGKDCSLGEHLISSARRRTLYNCWLAKVLRKHLLK